MEVVAGVVTAGNCLLAALVGVRLLRLATRSKGPEGWLGLYFLFGSLLTTLIAAPLYAGWANPELGVPPAWQPLLQVGFLASASIGLFAIGQFTRRTFRPADAWARHALVAGGLLLVVSFVGTGVVERFAVRVVNGPFYWLGFAVREAAIVWTSVESFRYYALVRRRLRHGLADPLVANRFLLLGLWAAVVSGLHGSDLLARVWYWAITGTASTWLPEAGRPIVAMMFGVTCSFGVVSGVSLFLGFFPTAAYRRWVLGRAAPAAGA